MKKNKHSHHSFELTWSFAIISTTRIHQTNILKCMEKPPWAKMFASHLFYIQFVLCFFSILFDWLDGGPIYVWSYTHMYEWMNEYIYYTNITHGKPYLLNICSDSFSLYVFLISVDVHLYFHYICIFVFICCLRCCYWCCCCISFLYVVYFVLCYHSHRHPHVFVCRQ